MDERPATPATGPLDLTLGPAPPGAPPTDPTEILLTEAVTTTPPARPALPDPAGAFPAGPATLPDPGAPHRVAAEGLSAATSGHGPQGGRWWASLLKPLLTFLVIAGATMYLFPTLLARWRGIESQSEAEAAYARRRAELKAEAEAAAQLLDAIDQRVQLVSLGFRQVVRKVTPNVVNVVNYREPRPTDRDGPLVLDPDNDRRYRQHGVGSGLIVQPGLILTNHHVVREAQRLRITFASGRGFSLDVENGKTVLHDAVTDLAVIRLPRDLPCRLGEDLNVTTEFADSDKDVHRGDLVLALGSPLGLKQTVTHGIVSAKGRLLDRITLVELLQTDAAINPGNSGGPLFDQYGRVAGINVAIASENGGNQGINFAIPSNTARKVFDQLVTHGEVLRGYIGVALADLTRAQAEELGLKRSGGVLVTQVVPGHGAARGGVRAGDVIVRYNGEPLSDVVPMRHLRQSILDTDVGREVTLEVIRDGRRQTLRVRVGKRPGHL
jgi:S1-C subfamily serine protease